jgi:hypothetical protein
LSDFLKVPEGFNKLSNATFNLLDTVDFLSDISDKHIRKKVKYADKISTLNEKNSLPFLTIDSIDLHNKTNFVAACWTYLGGGNCGFYCDNCESVNPFKTDDNSCQLGPCNYSKVYFF